MFFPRQLFFDMDTYIESKPLDDQEFYREVSKLSQLDHVFCYSRIKDVNCQLLRSLHLKQWWASLAVVIFLT